MNMIETIRAMSSDERAKCYADMNVFKWPMALDEFKPDKWDTLTWNEKHKHPIASQAWIEITNTTSLFEQNRAWWIYHLHKTAEEHLQWWNGEGKRGVKNISRLLSAAKN